jgi:uncharacterized protein YegP (UPF0339 family)
MEKFEIYTDKGGKYRFRLVAANGQIILASQGYATKANCKKGIESVKKNARLDARYQKKEVAGGKCHFNLVAANGLVIGTSQTYASQQGCVGGIKAVKTAARTAKVVEV